MNRNFDDIVPPDRRSIRKVSVSRVSRNNDVSHKETPLSAEVHSEDYSPRKNFQSRASRWGLWIIACISILIFAFGFSIVFSGAKIIVIPKQRTVLLDSQFEASRNPVVNKLGFEVMTLEKEGSSEVSANGSTQVEEKAFGTIVIYNNFNSSNQRLIKNTRFETPEGLIYRINASVVVPGQHKEGGTMIPGSVEAVVYADEAGEKYNIELSDFTVPGFKNDPRYSAFYARSKTPISGGFVGEKKIVSTEDEGAARLSIEASLREELTTMASSQKPDGFELYPDGIFVTFEPLVQENSGDKVKIREKATLYGIIFKKQEFAQFIAGNTIAEYSDEPVEITDPSALTVAFLNKEDSLWDKESISFTVKGNAHLVWMFDVELLKSDLAGKAKGALETVLTGYPSIDEAQIVFRPFWRQTFPEETEDIKVTTVIEK